jgi:hypothetical protein
MNQTELERMSWNKSADIRRQVTADTGCPVALLARLARDPSGAIRQSVAAHGNVTEEILAELATDKEPSVRLAVAGNEKASLGTLDLLQQDTFKVVRWEASKTIERLIDK